MARHSRGNAVGTLEGYWETTRASQTLYGRYGKHHPHGGAPTVIVDPPGLEYRCFGCGYDVRIGGHGMSEYGGCV